jgi:DNA anti-recombination protein RmuC
VHIDPMLAAIVASLIGLLLGIIGWFLRKDYARIEAGLKATNERLEQELKNERDARAKDRHELRDELNAERLQRHAFEVAVAKEYVSSAELEKALQPFSRTLEGFRETLGKVFDKLDTKADKHRGGDD